MQKDGEKNEQKDGKLVKTWSELIRGKNGELELIQVEDKGVEKTTRKDKRKRRKRKETELDPKIQKLNINRYNVGESISYMVPEVEAENCNVGSAPEKYLGGLTSQLEEDLKNEPSLKDDKECDEEIELENDEKKDELEKTKYNQKDGKKFRKMSKLNNKQHQKKIENYFNKRDTNKKRKRSDEEETIENEDRKKLKAGELDGNGEETERLNKKIMKHQQISGIRDPNPNYDYDPELKLMSELNSMKIKRLEN